MHKGLSTKDVSQNLKFSNHPCPNFQNRPDVPTVIFTHYFSQLSFLYIFSLTYQKKVYCSIPENLYRILLKIPKIYRRPHFPSSHVRKRPLLTNPPSLRTYFLGCHLPIVRSEEISTFSAIFGRPNFHKLIPHYMVVTARLCIPCSSLPRSGLPHSGIPRPGLP